MESEAMRLLEEENIQLKRTLHRIDSEKSAAVILSAQMAERIAELEAQIQQMRGLSSVYDRITALEETIRREAEYCYGHHAKLTETDPERAARHKARGDRLMTAIQS